MERNITIPAPLYNSPSNFDAKERVVFFKFDLEALKIIGNLSNPTNMLGFILQLGYFKANGKFFLPHGFRVKGIEHVSKFIHIKQEEICLKTYQKRILQEHKEKILKLLRWESFAQLASKQLEKHIS